MVPLEVVAASLRVVLARMPDLLGRPRLADDLSPSGGFGQIDCSDRQFAPADQVKTMKTGSQKDCSPLSAVDLSVRLGRLELPNPILVASGTFGYAREMEQMVNLSRLGGILPKTVTWEPRQGNEPWRTVETAAGMLNSIGLDNDGVEAFLAHHLPYLANLGVPVIVSVAGSSHDEFVRLAERFNDVDIGGIELNISCPNVSRGVDFGIDCGLCEKLVADCRQATRWPLIAKLTPNVTSIADIAQAAEAGGADAISLVNTCQGMAIDWRKRRSLLGGLFGGLSGPAIKPIALRCVCQAAQATKVPIIGIGGIATVDDVMEFLVAGANAVQLGTVNFYNPGASIKVLDALPAALAEAGAASPAELVGTLVR
jgi:dihydroorotate dehydrogenase (NAD+) catalytic subunit